MYKTLVIEYSPKADEKDRRTSQWNVTKWIWINYYVNYRNGKSNSSI